MVDCWKKSFSHLPMKLSEHVLPDVLKVAEPATSDLACLNEAGEPKPDFGQGPTRASP
jgi:hypothetical protein